MIFREPEICMYVYKSCFSRAWDTTFFEVLDFLILRHTSLLSMLYTRRRQSMLHYPLPPPLAVFLFVVHISLPGTGLQTEESPIIRVPPLFPVTPPSLFVFQLNSEYVLILVFKKIMELNRGLLCALY